VQRLRSRSTRYYAHVRGALRAYAWALSARGYVVPDWKVVPAKVGTPRIIEEYLIQAREQRGSAESTLDRDRADLIRLLSYLRDLGRDWRRVTLADIDGFLLQLTKRTGPAAVGRTASAIRGWLRFLFSTGRIRHDLASSVVAPVCRFHDRPPRALPWPEIKKILQAIDGKTPIGRRDRAQFLLMSGCGLGGAEVLRLQLSDIDWPGRRLRVVRPKTKAIIWLPLLPEIARSLADYIRYARPGPTKFQYVFLSRRMPFRPFNNSGVLRHRVRYLARRAGVETAILGTHVFRHSHATRHVVLGTDIKTLSDILGHRDPETTSLYTRSAVQRLRRLALPMPV
jgi:integrase/recombinase XerD